MAETKDPVKYVQEAIVKHQERVLRFYKTLWKRIKSLLKPLKDFLKDLLSATRKIAKTVGKSVVSKITSAIRAILDLLTRLEKALKSVILLGKRILATLRKATDQIKAIRFLKTVVRKYVEFIKQIWAMIADLAKQISILDAAIAILDTFSTVLRFVFNWITALIKGITMMSRNIGRHLKQGLKAFVKERKEAIQLGRYVAKMPVPKPG
jgi:phage-related protein